MISTVYIAKNVYGGDGLGRLGDGRVVFVPGAWAGEQVRAEIVEEKKSFVKARLVEIVEPSPERVKEEGSVPGMVYASLSYKGECAAKEQQLREFFERARISVGMGDSGWVSASCRGGAGTSAGMELNYRNKVVYHIGRIGGEALLPRRNKDASSDSRRDRSVASPFVIGYRTEPSHEIVDIASDPLARPEINAKLPEIRRQILMLLTTGPEVVRRETEKKANVTIRWTKKTGVKWWLGKAPQGLVLKETTLGRDFEVPADGFYQVNPEVGEELVRAVVAEYQKGAAVAPDILDLYCGVGVFGLCCASAAAEDGSRYGGRLTGIESGRAAIDFARRNAEAIFRCPPQPSTSTSSFRFYAEEVGRNLKRISVTPKTTVVIDPPRGGLEPGVARWLAQSKAPRIFYVSCDPATLMRDLKEISKGYKVESVRWFNMFPRTARFETLVILSKA